MTGVAVVTGGSRGLGAALGRDLATRGFAVALCATSAPAMHVEICRAVDVADASAVDRFAEDVARHLGPVDVWVNNAAVLGPVGWVRDVEPEHWERCVDVNLNGVMNGTRAFLAHRSAGATLVNISSRAGLSPTGGLTAYSATKAAVIAFTIAVAEEERAPGLRAFAVIPPSSHTDMQAALVSQDDDALPFVQQVRQRHRDGDILPANVVSERILDAVLMGGDIPIVVDLTAPT